MSTMQPPRGGPGPGPLRKRITHVWGVCGRAWTRVGGMSLRSAAGATTPARQPEAYKRAYKFVLDEGRLRQLSPPLPNDRNPNRYHKRNVREGWDKPKRLEEIEEALREKKMIEAIAWEIDNFPERFRAIESVKDLLDVEAPSIEVVD